MWNRLHFTICSCFYIIIRMHSWGYFTRTVYCWHQQSFQHHNNSVIEKTPLVSGIDTGFYLSALLISFTSWFCSPQVIDSSVKSNILLLKYNHCPMKAIFQLCVEIWCKECPHSSPAAVIISVWEWSMERKGKMFCLFSIVKCYVETEQLCCKFSWTTLESLIFHFK